MLMDIEMMGKKEDNPRVGSWSGQRGKWSPGTSVSEGKDSCYRVAGGQMWSRVWM